ncbi:DNA-damage inducible protein DDI1-like protein [Trypanosoma theileri]|uniref:DNA-damage inducible protein DDI1-like protein n=1 Tax=Trypanosoma theileri TaxID=67003 RepID=A0A1X0P3Q1_9TRYP|nr:DNA-damage inducible protein DDI1-like protein [Trypanosoma theileri]ORC91189.1 DNA-damage inducible protein DDI1-like protein [Trypanosoma theileri]
MVKIQCIDEKGNICTVDVDVNSLVDDMKAVLEVELGIPMDEQELRTASGMMLCSNETFSAQGIVSDTQLTVRRQPLQESQQPPPKPQPPKPQQQPQPQRSQQHPQQEERLSLDEARARIEQLFNARMAQGQGGWPMMNENDPNLQQRIYDHIQARNVDENLENALEHAPELFIPVTMLYVNCEINKHKVKAFIDSGAQKSIISARLAEECGLTRLINTKWKSLLRGVGAKQAIGHIHMTVVNLGGLFIPCSFCVLEDDNIDLIIGLDQLKRHRMIIDLKEFCLRIDDTAIPFLPDHEVPMGKIPDEEELQKLKGDANKSSESSSYPSTGVTSAGTAQTPGVAATAGAPTRTTGGTTGVSSHTSGSRQGGAINENAVANFMSLTGIDRERAILLLEAAGWDVNIAMSLLLDD